MKNIIRILAGLSFLIFFCPFFQMCSDEMLEERSETIEQFRESKEDHSLNAYELSVATDSLWFDIFFIAILASSLIIFIRSFKEDPSPVRFFCYFNLVIAIGFVMTIFVAMPIDMMWQLRYGYYLFLINTFAIIILCKKQYNSLN